MTQATLQSTPPRKSLLTERQVALVQKVLGYITLLAVAALLVLPLY